MDPEGIMLSNISQTEKDEDYMISLMCRIFKKTQKDRKTKTPETKLIDTENILVVARVGGWRRRY